MPVLSAPDQFTAALVISGFSVCFDHIKRMKSGYQGSITMSGKGIGL